ncbi:MAG: Cof-type HAD-IIB family hydrolase [Actinomycetales bacterium]|nr:Cof-type HAD-IIB family hydrolase [Actinomycetales bacterium]
MSKRPKLIATDLDGTIVHHDGTITQRTIDAFTRARDLGVHIYFVTGRPPRWMNEIREVFGFGEAICGNGAMLYDLHKREVTEEWMISKDQQIEIAQRMRKAIPHISFAIETHDYYHREKSYVPRWDIGLDNVGVERIEDAAKGPVFKMLARCSGGELTSDEMLEVALRELGGLVTVTHSNARESLLEISALGISKGTTLAKVAGRLGIDATDCVSFGDNPNDFSMLEWCGRSYAMADGHPDAINYAKDVAPSHHSDGVAIVIEKLLDLPA